MYVKRVKLDVNDYENTGIKTLFLIECKMYVKRVKLDVNDYENTGIKILFLNINEPLKIFWSQPLNGIEIGDNGHSYSFRVQSTNQFLRPDVILILHILTICTTFMGLN